MSVPEIDPAPSEAEAVAIMSAVEALWPKPVAASALAPRSAPSWRFSGRWWQRDRFAAADRPWT